MTAATSSTIQELPGTKLAKPAAAESAIYEELLYQE